MRLCSLKQPRSCSLLWLVVVLWLLAGAVSIDHLAAGRQAYARGDLVRAAQHFEACPLRTAEVGCCYVFKAS